MRFFISILTIALVAGFLEYFFPWWMIAIAAFVIAFSVELSPGKGFLAGFLGVLLLWTAVALLKDLPNGHILSQRMAVLFGLPHYGLFLLAASAVGGLVGGLSGWGGAVLRKTFFQ